MSKSKIDFIAAPNGVLMINLNDKQGISIQMTVEEIQKLILWLNNNRHGFIEDTIKEGVW